MNRVPRATHISVKPRLVLASLGALLLSAQCFTQTLPVSSTPQNEAAANTESRRIQNIAPEGDVEPGYRVLFSPISPACPRDAYYGYRKHRAPRHTAG